MVMARARARAMRARAVRARAVRARAMRARAIRARERLRCQCGRLLEERMVRVRGVCQWVH